MGQWFVLLLLALSGLRIEAVAPVPTAPPAAAFRFAEHPHGQDEGLKRPLPHAPHFPGTVGIVGEQPERRLHERDAHYDERPIPYTDGTTAGPGGRYRDAWQRGAPPPKHRQTHEREEKMYVQGELPKELPKGPWKPVANYYPFLSYQPAYRSGFYYSPWLHDAYGPRPYLPYRPPPHVDNNQIPWAPENAFKYPWELPPFPLVTAQSAQLWGYPGYYQNYPNMYPSGGAPGFEHPNYPMHVPGFWDELPQGKQQIKLPEQQFTPAIPGNEARMALHRGLDQKDDGPWLLSKTRRAGMMRGR